jgi:hypothetical protein
MGSGRRGIENKAGGREPAIRATRPWDSLASFPCGRIIPSCRHFLGGRDDLAPNRGPLFDLGSTQIKRGLKPDEKSRRNAEILLQSQGGIGGHSLPACKDVAQPASWDRHVSCRGRCGNAAGFQFIANQTGGRIGLEFHSSMGVFDSNEGDVFQVLIAPLKSDPPFGVPRIRIDGVAAQAMESMVVK